MDGSGSAFVTGSTYSRRFSGGERVSADARGRTGRIRREAIRDRELAPLQHVSGRERGNARLGGDGARDHSGRAGKRLRNGRNQLDRFPDPDGGAIDECRLAGRFAAKFSAAGALIYSTYLGGVNLDIGNAIAVDGSGNAYIAGQTTSANLASILGSSSPPTGIFDAFIIKLVPTGDAVAALVYLGGAGADTATAIALDAAVEHLRRGLDAVAEFPRRERLSNDQWRKLQRVRRQAESFGRRRVGERQPDYRDPVCSQTQQFTAMVSNTANTAVTWSLSPSTGTISSAGLYTAPATIATPQTVTVRATSVADRRKSATATVTLYPAVGVTVTPGTSTLYGAQTQQFSATVANAGNTAVTWSLSPSTGTISSTGLYTAPATVATPQTVTVRATSVADTHEVGDGDGNAGSGRRSDGNPGDSNALCIADAAVFGDRNEYLQ